MRTRDTSISGRAEQGGRADQGFAEAGIDAAAACRASCEPAVAAHRAFESTIRQRELVLIAGAMFSSGIEIDPAPRVSPAKPANRPQRRHVDVRTAIDVSVVPARSFYARQLDRFGFGAPCLEGRRRPLQTPLRSPDRASCCRHRTAVRPRSVEAQKIRLIGARVARIAVRARATASSHVSSCGALRMAEMAARLAAPVA